MPEDKKKTTRPMGRETSMKPTEKKAELVEKSPVISEPKPEATDFDVILKQTEEIAKLKGQLELQDKAASENSEMAALKAQVGLLTTLVSQTQTTDSTGKKLLFKPVPANDYQDKAVTFTARAVFYIIASYRNNKGMEIFPPYKLLKFQYAASDRRMDGKEEEIINFSTFTTHLKAEIKFLREHNLYGITFSENANTIINEDVRKQEYRTRAAQAVSAMSEEAVIGKAREMKIPNVMSATVRDLRTVIVHGIANDYELAADALDKDLAQRRLVAHAAIEDE
jgi:hypothetical protein